MGNYYEGWELEEFTTGKFYFYYPVRTYRKGRWSLNLLAYDKGIFLEIDKGSSWNRLPLISRFKDVLNPTPEELILFELEYGEIVKPFLDNYHSLVRGTYVC